VNVFSHPIKAVRILTTLLPLRPLSWGFAEPRCRSGGKGSNASIQQIQENLLPYYLTSEAKEYWGKRYYRGLENRGEVERWYGGGFSP
jgi:hypothetical protein